MCLIFDRFWDRKVAEWFAADVRQRYPKFSVFVCDNQGESNEIDPFPFELAPPIVLVGRPPNTEAPIVVDLPPFGRRESAIIRRVREFGGRFAGT